MEEEEKVKAEVRGVKKPEPVGEEKQPESEEEGIYMYRLKK